MKIAQLNMTHSGSTGRIMFQIADAARKEGHEVRTYTPVIFSRVKKQDRFSAPHHYTWGTIPESAFHYYAGCIIGQNGRFSHRGTKNLIKELKQFQPDVIHLHNLHSFCINLPMLFRYIKKQNICVIWTLHDCWTFTGHCPHFSMIGCDKWKTGCKKCPIYRSYPKSYIDDSEYMYKLKKQWFTGVENMMLITPSQWLADLTRESFLKDYPVQVIHNGIDLSFFKPIESDFRTRYHCENKKILLGVAFGWSIRKGLDIFIELAKRLDNHYQIVLVGTDENVDKQLPENIISIHRTQNQRELTEIYSAADLFVNPTREENYPTVNMEAIACGTPVLTFRTGGSPEILDETCGSVVECDNIDALEQEIVRITQTKPYTEEACLKRTKEFDMNDRFEEYVKLYEEVTKQ